MSALKAYSGIKFVFKVLQTQVFGKVFLLFSNGILVVH